MFSRPHHRRLAAILQALDADLLASAGCYFGGGTAIALRHGEYRESVDLDFLVSDTDGYQRLRELVRGVHGINALTRQPLTVVRGPLVDQYGIRAVIGDGREPVKFEIVSEGRINLETPQRGDDICGVATLTDLDMATSKLLANSDRWADRATHSRDLIDLAMMDPSDKLLTKAISKAEGAYRSSIITDLDKAISFFRENPHRLDECMRALRMTDTPKAVLWERIVRLQR